MGRKYYSNIRRKKPKRSKVVDNHEVDLCYFKRWKSCKSSTSLGFCFVFTICATATFFTASFLDEQQRQRQNIQTSSSSSGYTYIDWKQITDIGFSRIGSLNFNDHRQVLLSGVNSSVIDLEHVQNDIPWASLYPEWINEDQGIHESERPICPSLPDVLDNWNPTLYDLIAVNLPCNKSGDWSRDVNRLHLQLSAAKLAAAVSGGDTSVHVLFVTECFPIPNLFRLKDLVLHEGNIWMYKPDMTSLKQSIQLPIGSCKLAVPSTSPESRRRPESMKKQREAYVTILHSANFYVCGAIAAARSIRMTGSTRDLVILVDKKISYRRKKGLKSAGWKVRVIDRIRNPKADREAYNRWNYSKFRLWQLINYDKIVFIDADLIVLRNIDFLFTWPEITATGNDGTLFNSGVMVIEPSIATFNLLMDHIHDIKSYNGGDQGYLNEVFTWWHRMPRTMNFLKHFLYQNRDAIKKKNHLFTADPPELYVLHYLGIKPWWCYRDYDCNWNVHGMRKFASDAAHRRWWKVYDSIPVKLRSFCWLGSKQKAFLERDRIQAKKSNFSDRHWMRTIRDRRLKICNENPCYRKSMLSFWLDQNITL